MWIVLKNRIAVRCSRTAAVGPRPGGCFVRRDAIPLYSRNVRLLYIVTPTGLAEFLATSISTLHDLFERSLSRRYSHFGRGHCKL